MKRRTRTFAVLLSAIICLGALAGCSESSSDNSSSSSTGSSVTQSSSDADSTDESEASQTEDIIGEVSYIGSSSMTLNVYEADTEISDYASLDSVTLSDTGNSDKVDLESDAVVEYASDGYMYSTTIDEVAYGDMVAVTTNEDGLQEIIILDYASEDSADSSSDTSDTGTDASTAE